MINIKSKSELENMKKAGYIVALVHKAFADAVKPGVTTKELDNLAKKIIEDNGAKPSFLDYYGYPASVCASLNDVVVHGIPDNTVLKDGDIISLDVGAEYNGYHGDSA
jgi:methionyl aminopeptidase